MIPRLRWGPLNFVFFFHTHIASENPAKGVGDIQGILRELSSSNSILNYHTNDLRDSPLLLLHLALQTKFSLSAAGQHPQAVLGHKPVNYSTANAMSPLDKPTDN